MFLPVIVKNCQIFLSKLSKIVTTWRICSCCPAMTEGTKMRCCFEWGANTWFGYYHIIQFIIGLLSYFRLLSSFVSYHSVYHHNLNYHHHLDYPISKVSCATYISNVVLFLEILLIIIVIIEFFWRRPLVLLKVFSLFFSCPEQLNRWPCHSLTHWLTESLTVLLLLTHKEQLQRLVSFETSDLRS